MEVSASVCLGSRVFTYSRWAPLGAHVQAPRLSELCPPGQIADGLRTHTQIGERGEDNAVIVSPSRVPPTAVKIVITIIVRIAPRTSRARARPSGCRSARRESSPQLARPATFGPGVNLFV